MSNYPLGAEYDPRAPYNQEENSDKEIEVEVTLTSKKIVKITVNDYDIVDKGKDEDGTYWENIDYSNCCLEGAVRDQIELPKDWDIEDIDVERIKE